METTNYDIPVKQKYADLSSCFVKPARCPNKTTGLSCISCAYYDAGAKNVRCQFGVREKEQVANS